MEARTISDRDITRWVKGADTPAEGYARYLAAVERAEQNNVIHPGASDFHRSDPRYQKAAEKVATDTNTLHSDLAGPGGLLDTFENTRLSIQTGRWQVNETYEDRKIRSTYSLEKDPTDYTEAIEKVGTYSQES